MKSYLCFSDTTGPAISGNCKNFLERAVVLSTGSVLHLPQRELNDLFEDKTSDVARTLAERYHISEVLKQTRRVVGGRDGAAVRL